MEEFAKVERIIPTDLDRAGNEDDDGIRIGGGLDVRGLDGVRDAPDGAELLDDGGGAPNLLPLEGKHRLFILL